MNKRAFRTPESLSAERRTRELVPNFLRSAGYTSIGEVREIHGSAISQTIHAIGPDGRELVMRVRLCWRRRPGKGDNYSAAQLKARVTGNDWEGDIRSKIERQRSEGVTHLLLVQPGHVGIESAALIPLDAVLPIWKAQRDVSKDLITRRLIGIRTKNHAMNGRSPTIYLRDDRHPNAHAVADALWNHAGVIDLVKARVEAQEIGPPAAFGDPESNALVERAAIEFVWNRYRLTGWTVRSVESDNVGYDLECRKGRAVRHIEVKGRSGRFETFVLTSREYEKADCDSAFVLAIVTLALTAEPRLEEYTGAQFLDLFDVKPLQYVASKRLIGWEVHPDP